MDGENKGHGHVFSRPDGIKSRCGGPGFCNECARDFYVKMNPGAAPDAELKSIWEQEYRQESERAPGILAPGNFYRIEDAVTVAMRRAYRLGKEAR